MLLSKIYLLITICLLIKLLSSTSWKVFYKYFRILYDTVPIYPNRGDYRISVNEKANLWLQIVAEGHQEPEHRDSLDCLGEARHGDTGHHGHVTGGQLDAEN